MHGIGVVVSGQTEGLCDQISSEIQGQLGVLEQKTSYLCLMWAVVTGFFLLFQLVLHGGFLFVFFFLILGLPIQVRDAGLSLKDEMPKSDVNKEYYTQNMEREVKKCCYDLCVWMCTREGGGLTHFPWKRMTHIILKSCVCSFCITCEYWYTYIYCNNLPAF